MYRQQSKEPHAARLDFRNFDFTNYRGEDIVKPLNWQTVKERFVYLTACMMFKAVNCLQIIYLIM